MMEKDIHLQYTEDLTKLSVLYYCWAVTGKLIIWAVALSIFSFFFLTQYEGSTMVTSLIVFTLILVPTFIGFLYYMTRKRALEKFRKLKDGKALFGITEDNFSLTVEGASTTLPWAAIFKIKQHPDFWIIFLRPNGYFTLPTYNLMQEDKDIILQKLAGRRRSGRGLFPKQKRPNLSSAFLIL